MRLPAALSSAAFRFGLMLAIIVAIGASALLFAVERQVGHYAREATAGMLRTETAVLVGEHADLGLSGLTDAIARHRGTDGDPPYRYLLVDASGRRLAGDLPSVAGLQPLGFGTVRVREEQTGEGRYEQFETMAAQLPDGLRLVVATDSFDVQDLRGRLERFTILSGLLIASFALAGGYVVGQAFLRRLRSVNRAIDRIVAGERAERLPMIGFGPEFDDLALNLNHMLDRNAAAMEALRQVSTDIAHDLRTPLTRLHQRLEAMCSAGAAEPVQMEQALAQVREMLSTFEALLRIGTMEGGVGRQRFRALDLSEVMDNVHQAYAPVAEDAGKSFSCDHRLHGLVWGDPELLAQLFTNLVENAIVHTPPGTGISSRLRTEGGRIVAEICDTGPGIPPAERQKVFRRFYRRDASRTTQGAGLGLALVAAISSLHEAECTIADSEGGNCVRIIFPPLPKKDQVAGTP